MFIARKSKVTFITIAAVVGIGGFFSYFMSTQKPMDSMVEIDKPIADSNEISVQPTDSTVVKPANRELEDVNTKSDKLSLEEKLDQLVQLDTSVNQKIEHFEKLVHEYDQDLSNTDKQKALSTALLDSSKYRSDILQKFKIEREHSFLGSE